VTRDGRLWPWGVGLVLGVTMAGNFWVMRLASADASFAIEPDYYRKAVAWDSTIAQAGRNTALGWHLDASLGRGPAGSPGGLEVILQSADGTPVDSATIRVEATHNARAAEILTADLRPTGRGRYRADLPTTRRGRWELRFTAVRGADHFTATLRRETSPAVSPP